MTSRLVCLLAVDWKDFGTAREADMARFQDLVTQVAEARDGKYLEHPIKSQPERRVYLFPGPSACLEASLALRASLREAQLAASQALHTGECLEREGRLLGSPILEVAELASQGGAGELGITEVFRLTLPLEAKEGWVRQDEPRVLAGNPWTVSLRMDEEGG